MFAGLKQSFFDFMKSLPIINGIVQKNQARMRVSRFIKPARVLAKPLSDSRMAHFFSNAAHTNRECNYVRIVMH